jgi:hypothetical protein
MYEIIVEDSGNDDKEGEEHELYKETTDDEALAKAHGVRGTHSLDATTYIRLLASRSVFDGSMDNVPEPWSIKLNTSPATNVFVSHFRRTNE